MRRCADFARTPAGENVLAAGFLLALTLAVFGRVLFGPGNVVLSNIDADLAKQFVHWRAFGFGELRAGHLALWNPYIFGGEPYFGGFQSALLYPPNWLYLVLPLARAINIGIALHVFLAGWFMFLWTRQRGLHPLAGVFAGVSFMFCGPYFPHVYAGHLPNLCTMVWAPLLFLSIDGWLGKRAPVWLLLGAGVVALQILAGHPQYVFYTGVAAAIYCLLHLLKTPRRVQAAAGLAAMVAGAVGLGAVQLFEGFHAAGESVRSVGISPELAGMFSFPPENFLTFLVPGFFGDMTSQEYWGRCYLWEMSVFFGVSGLVMAVYGAWRGEKSRRRFCLAIALMLFLPALGAHTPLFDWLYLHAPGFDKFRGWSKFTFPAMLFLVMLAAVGFDRMLRRGLAGRGMGIALLMGGSALLAATGVAYFTAQWSGGNAPSPWAGWMQAIRNTSEQLTPLEDIQTVRFVWEAALFAAREMLIAAGTMLALGVVFLAARKRPRAMGIVLMIATAEMLRFAYSSLDTFPLENAADTAAAQFLRSKPASDERVLNKRNANLGMTLGKRDVWGDDPGVLLRYAEWMAATQGIDPDDANQMLTFNSTPPAFATLLRCRYVFDTTTDDQGEEKLAVTEMPLVQVSPRLRLVSRFRLMSERNDIIAATLDHAFDPASAVILETPPIPAPAPTGPSGTAAVVAETTDSLTIEATLPAAAVLLVTDAYCTGWQARSLLSPTQSKQAQYSVLPADYCLRAIPLASGFHRILLEYRPRAFVIGKWVSLASLIIYIGLIAVYTVRRRAKPNVPSPSADARGG